MTTGRINQVTTFLKCPAITQKHNRPTDLHQNGASFRPGSFIRWLDRINRNSNDLSSLEYLVAKANSQNTLFPDLTNFENTSPGHNKATKMVTLRENYQQPTKVFRR